MSELPAIRRARPDDAAALMPLTVELYVLEGLFYEPERARGALDRLIASPDLGFVLVADDPAGGLAGYAICTFGYDLEFAGRDAFLTEILVAAPWRGRGLGGALLDAVEREAAACDVQALQLLVRPDNPAGLALYTARGWEPRKHVVLGKRLR